MVDKKDCPDGSCPVDHKKEKLVKATDLPLNGNPYPPRDVFQNDRAGYIETQVRNLRTSLQPIISPIHSAYEHTSDFLSIGVAHSQSAIQRLGQNQSSVLNASIIAGSGLLGVVIARRGFFRRFLFGSVFFTGALVACYPKDAEEKGKMLLYIAKNKLPEVAKNQYDKLTKGSNSAKENKPQKTE